MVGTAASSNGANSTLASAVDIGGPAIAVDDAVTSTILTKPPNDHGHDHDNDHDADDESSPLLAGSNGSSTANSTTTIHPKSAALTTVPISPTKFWTVILVICVQAFFMAFDLTITSSSHPVISSYFHASHLASWLTTGFLLTNIAANPLTVALADPLGRRFLMTFNGVVVALATAWCGIAGSMTSLILARALCGAGMAGGGIIGGLMMSDLIPIKDRGKYHSCASLFWGVGMSLGAALGGILADLLGWRWIFGIQVPILATLPILSWIIVPDDLGRAGMPKHTIREAFASFDYLGTVLITVSATSFVLLASIGGNTVPWTHPLAVACGITVVVAGAWFVRVEQTAAKPVFPLRLITHWPFDRLYGASFVLSLVQNGIYFTVPVFFQAVRLSSATTSGLQMVSPTVSNLIFGVGTSLGIGKWGLLSPYNRAGPCLLTFGILLVCFFDPSWPRWAYYAALFPIGAGLGLFWPSTTIATVAYTPAKDQPATSGLTYLTRNIGSIAGVAASGLVLQNALVAYLDEFVQGPDKAEIVERVRLSVEAVRALPEPYRAQVVKSYEGATAIVFWTFLVLSLATVPAIVTLRLARIGEIRVSG